MFENVLVCLERPTEAYVREESSLIESVLVAKVERRRNAYTEHESVGALIAVAYVAEEEITEAVFLVCEILDFAILLVCVLCTRIPTVSTYATVSFI